MSSDLSRITLGTPFSLRQAAVASPEGPAPTITGPGTKTERMFPVPERVSWTDLPSISLKYSIIDLRN